MKYSLLAILFIFLASCHKQEEKVSWFNEEEVIDYNSFIFELKSDNTNKVKHCYLYTSIQAVELKLEKSENNLRAHIPYTTTLHSGPARLVIQTKDGNVTSYTFIGKKNLVTELKDFRSPKTLITDSSLGQQQLVYTVSASRNILHQKNKIAIEKWKELPPTKATYQAQKEKLETSYYVESGSPKKIKLTRDMNNNDSVFQFYTNLLKDKFGNIIATGTKATLHIEQDQRKTKINTYVRNGLIKLNLPNYIQPPFMACLEIGMNKSNRIIID